MNNSLRNIAVIAIVLFAGARSYSQVPSESVSQIDSLLFTISSNSDLRITKEDILGIWDKSDGFTQSSIKFKDKDRFIGKDSGCFGTYNAIKGEWNLINSTIELTTRNSNYSLILYQYNNQIQFLSPDQIEEAKVLLEDYALNNTFNPKLRGELIDNLISSGWVKK